MEYCKNHKEVKVSVIIPVFNNERYLSQCVNSVLCQSLIDLEILLVDDGSTDSSSEICDSYAAQDSRVKTIHKSNTGVSDSRNRALDLAVGEYIITLDSDDYWYDNTCLEQLYDAAESYQVDIVRGEYKAVDAEGNDLFVNLLNDRKQANFNKLLDAATFVKDVVQREYFLCLCLIRRTYLDDLRYNNDKIFMEDAELFLRILLKSPLCYYLPLRFYAYRKHVGTVSTTNSLKKLKDAFDMSDFLYDCATSSSDERLKLYCLNEGVRRYFLSMSSLATDSHFMNRRDIIENLNLDKLQRKVKTWMALTGKKYYSPVYHISPYTGVWYMRIRNSLMDTIYNIRQLCKR